MADYAKMYHTVFNATTDAIEILKKAQQQTEELYLSAPDPEIRVLEPKKPDDDMPEKE